MHSGSSFSITRHPMAAAKGALLKRIKGYIDQRYLTWNLDAALRYLPVADHLDRLKPKRVVDVGSAGTGLSLYWGKKTIGLDIHINPHEVGPLTTPVMGTGFALPFKDRSVDAVVGADMLEHIPHADRKEVLSEMIRVARKEVIVAVPCGHASHLTEVEVNASYQKKTGTPHPWLKEHLLYGLPEARALEEEIRSLALSHGRRVQIQVKDNVNLWLWRVLFPHYIGGGPRTERLMFYYLLALLPLLRHVNWGRVYRKIFFVHMYP